MMNARSPRFLCLSLLVSLIGTFLSTAVRAEQAQPVYPKVGPGLTYIQERIGDAPWSIHVLKIDRSRKDFTFVSTLGNKTIFGLEQLTSQIKRLQPELGEPVAAVNGDFFNIYKSPYRGDMRGLHIRRGELVSHSRGVNFWLDAQGQPQIGKVENLFQISWPDGTTAPFGVNKERYDSQVMLYTPTLGESTRTQGGVEMVLEAVNPENWLPLKAGKKYRAKIKSISKEGNTALSPTIMVLSIGPKSIEKIPAVQPGDEITLSTAMSPDMENVQTAVGGNLILVHDGKIQDFPDQIRHPRTLIGYNDRYLFLVVVDGRQKDLSRGMSYQEEAELMLRLGATEAINIDGGGSSTFWLGGKIMNSPSDGCERSIANGLILLRKLAPTTATAPTEKK